MIVHGTADKIVDIKYAKEAVETYRKEGNTREVKYYEIEDGAHMFSKKHDKIAIEYLGDFCAW